MLRLLTLFLLGMGPVLASASPCYQIHEAAQRLACYNRMAACLGIKSNKARLACLDRKIRNGASMQATQTRPQANTSRQPTATEQAQAGPGQPSVATFGLEPKQLNHMSSSIVKVTHRFDGVDIITLANHQVWRTSEEVDGIKAGQHVTIKPGIFGTYNLYRKGIHQLVKVLRLK